MSNNQPFVFCYPNHPLPHERLQALLKIHSHHRHFKSLKSIRYIACDNTFVVKGGKGGMTTELVKTWELFDPIYEAELWTDLIEERIKDPRLKQWVGSIVWWDRSYYANEENWEAWRAFEKRYKLPFRSTIEEFLQASSQFLYPHEIKAIRSRERLDLELIPDKTRRAKAARAMEKQEDSWLDAAMKAIGYKKVKN